MISFLTKLSIILCIKHSSLRWMLNLLPIKEKARLALSLAYFTIQLNIFYEKIIPWL